MSVRIESLRDAFYQNSRNILFPNEEIVFIAKKIKNAMVISKQSIERHCTCEQIPSKDVYMILQKLNYSVSDHLIYELLKKHNWHLKANITETLWRCESYITAYL